MSLRFVTTHWSVVLAAGDVSHSGAQAALATLCEAYWYPLYAFVRRSGYDSDRAQDVTQDYFADVLERQALRGLDPAKGRFRAFLLASLRHFLSHERDRTRAAKRGGGVTTLSIDQDHAEQRFDLEAADTLTPEQIFERRWGLTVMERAMARLTALNDRPGRQRLFTALKPYLTGADVSYREIATELSIREGAVKVAVHRLRKSYGRLLRIEIADTVTDESQVDDELRHLLSNIRPWQG